MEIEKKAKNDEEVVKEIFPFFIYAAIPLVIIITIAFVFGPSF